MIPTRMRWPARVKHKGEIGNSYEIVVAAMGKTRASGDKSEADTKTDMENWDEMCELNSVAWGKDILVVGSCEHLIENLASVRGE
jgi:hypothetical protein